jgi:hypothetical protein
VLTAIQAAGMAAPDAVGLSMQGRPGRQGRGRMCCCGCARSSVTTSGAHTCSRRVLEGPCGEQMRLSLGTFIIDARDMDAAVPIAARCPVHGGALSAWVSGPC